MIRQRRGGGFGPLAALLDDDVAYRVSDRATADRRYWFEALDDWPEAGSFTLGERSPAHAPDFLRATMELPERHVVALRAAAARAGTNLSRLLVAAGAILLHRMKGTQDVVVGLPVAVRNDATRNVPGMVSNVLPLRVAVRPDMTVRELIAETAVRVRDVLEHQHFQLPELRRIARANGDDRALFGLSVNVMRFDYGFRFGAHRTIAHNLSLGPVEDVSISVYDRADAGPLRIDADVNPAFHSDADLAAYKQRFLNLLTCLADPDAAIGNLKLLEAAERETILRQWSETASSSPRNPDATLPSLFAAQAMRTPDATAVVFEDRALTYAALDARANRLANHLRGLGVGPETVVGLCVERSPEMVVGLLGILKAGAAYLPLDPNYPRERLDFMLTDAGAPVLVTQQALLDRLPVVGRHRASGRRWAADRPPARHRAAVRSIRATLPM